jgi:hypothetical protein
LWANQEIRINMTKNTTRKGLAFGAGIALVASGFAGAPAQAVGIENGVTLAPEIGKDYAVLIGQNFDLEANFANSVEDAGEFLKFYVDDEDARTTVTAAGTSIYAALGTSSSSAGTSANDDITVTFSNGHNFKTGDIVDVANAAGTDNANINQANVTVTVTGNTVVFPADGAPNASGALTLSTQPTLTLDVTTFARSTVVDSTENDYVVDTRSDDNSVAKDLSLNAASGISATVNVTAWVDTNDNNKIDDTENRSPERAIQFVDAGDLAATTTLTQPIIGDAALEARVTFVPVLNGLQVTAQDPNFVNVEFMRQDSALKRYAEDVQSTDAATSTSVWNVLGKYFSVVIPLDADSSGTGDSDTEAGNASDMAGTTTAGWTDIDRPATALSQDGSPADTEVAGVLVSVDANDIATATVRNYLVSATPTFTAQVHNLSVGDKITFGAGLDALLVSKEFTVTAVPSTTTFQFALDNNETADAEVGTSVDNDYTVTTYAQIASRANVALVDRVFAGTYSAQAVIDDGGFALAGAKASLGTVAAVSADVVFSTVGSSTVQGAVVKTTSSQVIQIKEDETSVSLTMSVIDEDLKSVGAGRPVVVAVTGESSGILVNGTKADSTLYTDANGQILLTVTDTAGKTNAEVVLTATPEGQGGTAISSVKLDWVAQAYSLVDLNSTSGSLGDTTRTIVEDSSYTLNLGILDQWFTEAPSATYRIRVSGDGAPQGIQNLVSGRTSVIVSDTGAFATTFTTTVDVQKLTSGVWADTSADADIINNLVASGSVLLGADASSLYQPSGSSEVVDLSDVVSLAAIVAIDKRVSSEAKPDYTNALVIQGKTVSGTTSAALAGAPVTISGPANILFENGEVSARGSLTLFSDTSGEFEVTLYSTTNQTDSVITVASLGGTKTTKVTFTGQGVGEGTVLTVTMPVAVKPASTFQVKAKLSDALGNGVNTAAGSIKVTYSGAGIVFGTLPTETDANGELMFSVLLGSNDTGSVNVTVSYDQNADLDFVDAKDLNTSGTTAITASGVAASETKVNVGSFKGFVALYAKGYEGQKMSAIVAGKWIVVESLASDFERVVRFTGAGYTITTKIYIDGVQIGDAFTTVTK